MIIKNSEFVTSAFKIGQYPKSNGEIALAGRSNVGKSSFLNKILNRKGLARTSKVQGKTASINYFLINNEFFLVDLPGYGYATVSKAEQQRWGKMIEDYLNSREELKSVILLLDIRHKPTKDDIMMFNYIVGRGLIPFIVLTKADKVSKTEAANQKDAMIEMFETPHVYPFSSKNGSGRDEILARIGEIICD